MYVCEIRQYQMYISSKQSFYEDYETMSFIQTVLQYLSIKQQITLPDTGEPSIFRIHNTEARRKTKIKHQKLGTNHTK